MQTHKNPEMDIVNPYSWDSEFKRFEEALAQLQMNTEALNRLTDEHRRRETLALASQLRRIDSPYFTKEEAADYLRTSVDAIYGRVERGQLKRCPGVREYLFTKEMLDESVMGGLQKPAPKKPNARKSKPKEAS